jgi:hypothetical protein
MNCNPGTLTTPTAPTVELSEAAIIWCRGGNAALTAHLIATAPYRCPQCGDPCGHLFHDADTPNGACLGCKVGFDDHAVADYERFEAATYGADTACSCGID